MTNLFDLALLVIMGAGALSVLTSAVGSMHHHHHGMFFRDRGEGGGREFRLRLAAAALRRKTTHAVLARPDRCDEIIRRAIKKEAMQLAAADKSLGKQFVAWADGADLSEILYPAALKAVHRHTMKAARPRIGRDRTLERDMVAALRVRG